jgi:EEF1A N-terminal glycine/lysine methyltransferase
LIKGKSVLELGAGAGLPSLACTLLGAQTVVTSDYPDPDLIENLRYNIDRCSQLGNPKNVFACGYLWGNPISPLTDMLQQPESGFDVLILADILFNHSQHDKLVKTIGYALRKSSDAVALVFFTPYRPWLLDKDLAFFDLAENEGFIVSKILQHTMVHVMFVEDPGDELLRKTVFGYEVRWKV